MQSILVQDITKQYAGAPTPAVDHVSFEVEPGEFVALVGPSGCGKTTLLKMVNRLYEPTSGTILVNGTDIRTLAPTELRRGIGYVIQATGLFPHLTIEENIATVPKLLSWAKARWSPRVDELLELVQLPFSYRKRYPAQLSGGEQQRVGIARALAADPPVLLMDEPFGAIDAITRADLQRELRAIQRRLRKTVLFVTHDMEEALLLADRLLVLRAGRVEQYGSPQQVVLEPANEFVATLVGADDLFRRLSLVRVDSLMEALPDAPLPDTSLPPDATLRDAMATLLQGNYRALTVRDEQGEPLGLVTLDALRVAAGGMENREWSMANEA